MATARPVVSQVEEIVEGCGLAHQLPIKMWMGGNQSTPTVTASKEECEQYYSNFNYSQFDSDIHCNTTWDNILCWPPTKPNTKIILPCPPLKGVNPAEFAFRVCGFRGGWYSQDGSENGEGWTNYTKCFLPEMRELIDKIYSNSEEDGQMKYEVANNGRVLETVGLSISLAAILISLIIFSSFRSLRNNRTRIHWHLFVAMKIQLVVRLVLYIDQYVTRTDVNGRNGIDNTPILCESFYILLEYARTAMFLWMFIEGLYLHNMVTVSVFQDKPNYRIYYVIGWGLPLIMTSIWVAVMIRKYTNTECWWGYNLSSYFWILEGPRLTVIFTNLLFLLNILRVLITKLKATASSESRQMRKAARAAIVLLPLLGITNCLGMLHSPVDSDFVRFAAWTYGTTFLKAFQGFFVALIYCFLNHEVRSTLRKTWNNYLSRRYIEEHRRHSLASFQLYRTSTGKRFAHMDFNSISAPQEIEVAAV